MLPKTTVCTRSGFLSSHPPLPHSVLSISVLVCVSSLYICVLLSVFVFLCNTHEHTHNYEHTTHTHTPQTTDSTAERNEEQPAISEPPIKLVHVLNPGEREYLSPNLIGVQNIAMTFLPLSMNFINIIDAFREIVNGVRYEILLNAVDTKQKDADTICRLVILEKPWLTTQWGDKHRELVNSNCSDIADNALDTDAGTDLDPDQRAKSLNDKYVSNSIFNGGRRNELSDSEMAQLEAQILPSTQSKRQYSSSSSSSSGNSMSDSGNSGFITSSTGTITSSSSSTTATPQNTPQADPTNEPTTSISVDEAAATGEAGELVEVDATPTTPAAELNDNEKRWLDDFLSVGAFNFEKTIEQQRTELKQQQQEQQQQEREQQQQQHEEEPQQGREQQQEQLPVQEEQAQQAEVSSS